MKPAARQHQHAPKEPVAATPAIDGSMVYTRTKTHLFAFRREQARESSEQLVQ
ncbi:MAG: hypothetical protein H8E44_13820 [Planctomycetes bacterium]|nr:hypothetical protein [Planctomycetota bacterium]